MNERTKQPRRLRTEVPGVAPGIPASRGPLTSGKSNVLAIHGGTPVRSIPYPDWPQTGQREANNLLASLHSHRWCADDGDFVPRFETAWRSRLGIGGCVMTPCGTHALHMALELLGVGPGDEVIVAPFTFVATIDAILSCYALPIFADTDLKTFQIDADDIEHRITERTRAIMPVHIYGAAANMDKVLAIANKYNIPVIEDACQAHMAEWRGKKLGTLGRIGCFSFQERKNLPGGEAGAMVSDDSALINQAYMYRDVGRDFSGRSRYAIRGTTYMVSDFAASVLMAQLETFDDTCSKRERNAAFLREEVAKIPGFLPQEHYPGCTRANYHAFGLRYDDNYFYNLPREKLVAALKSEGIPINSVYPRLNKEPYLEDNLNTRGFSAVFSPDRLAKYRLECELPHNDELCRTGLWISQRSLIGDRGDTLNVLDAIYKVRENVSQLL